MSTMRVARSRLRVSARDRVDVALLHFFLAYRNWRNGLGADPGETARRMAEALGWRGETGEGD